MDVSNASYYISNEKKKNKGSQMGHTKKYSRKKIIKYAACWTFFTMIIRSSTKTPSNLT
jgi:hypothetical protein